ncbi:uncharacterized protein LTR77_007908 [Saxophila tyrrhenica]|uniref:GPR1/FUN34/YaaH-class plasma membrane protein n=1 Tax=Saxophila tyrrhenica TaxID=1690608 RepID=A0AAV9P440_9PEZI|nr:hypothetical protein LTR77_007908 [Saxophila tyrrhenica]
MSGENHGQPLEKDFSNGYHLDSNHDADDALRRIRTTGSLSISPELFEKIYLSPQNKVAGELRKTVGNPTPFALVGFLLSLTPLSCDLMGWRGAPTNGASSIGVYFTFGGILMTLGSIGEWILGNTFPCVVFGSFGAFWFAFGITLTPYSGAYGSFSPNPDNPGLGVETTEFTSGFAFFLVFMGVLCLVYAICALRTNLILFLILLLLVPAFACLAAAYWFLAQENALAAAPLLTAGGAIAFVVCMLGWYIFAAILLAAVDFPLSLPVFDLSHIIKGASDKKKAKEAV